MELVISMSTSRYSLRGILMQAISRSACKVRLVLHCLVRKSVVFQRLMCDLACEPCALYALGRSCCRQLYREKGAMGYSKLGYRNDDKRIDRQVFRLASTAMRYDGQEARAHSTSTFHTHIRCGKQSIPNKQTSRQSRQFLTRTLRFVVQGYTSSCEPPTQAYRSPAASISAGAFVAVNYSAMALKG